MHGRLFGALQQAFSYTFVRNLGHTGRLHYGQRRRQGWGMQQAAQAAMLLHLKSANELRESS
jgi:hypothetical protein